MKRMTVTLAVCTLFLATSIQAQAPQGPPKPGPELKKLDYNIGTWNVQGEAKPFGPMPGGKFTATEKCEWYSGGFFVMCHSPETQWVTVVSGTSCIRRAAACLVTHCSRCCWYLVS